MIMNLMGRLFMRNIVTVCFMLANVACIVFHPVMPYVLFNALALILLTVAYEK
jgi:hypothetical protein